MFISYRRTVLATNGIRPYDVLVLRRNDFTIDGRVERQAASLAGKGLRVLVLTLGGNRLARAENREGYDLERLPIDQEIGLGEMMFGRLARRGSLRRRLGTLTGTAAYYEEAVRRALAVRPAVIHCHDLDTLAPGVMAAGICGARVIYDSAELWTERNTGFTGLRRRLDHARYTVLERLLIRGADAVITVSDGIAAELTARYGILRPEVIRNVPRMPGAQVRRSLRAKLGGEGPIILHLGIVDMNRGIEAAVRSLTALPGARLALMGPARPHVMSPLRELARGLGVSDRVIHLPPVPRDEIIAWAAEADVGLCTFQPVCLSHVLAMPNKLYEYAFAGVPIVASDLPDMAHYIRKNNLGLLCNPDDPRDLAGAVRRVFNGDVPRKSAEELRAFCAAEAWEREFVELWRIYCRLI